MLQCGLLRSNFSLAMGSYGRCFMWKMNCGDLTWSGWRESNPRIQLGRLLHYHCATPAEISLLLAPRRGGGSRTRTYEGVRQGIYSPPPLPLGTFPQRARSRVEALNKRLPPRDATGQRAAQRMVPKAATRPGPQFGARLIVAS